MLQHDMLALGQAQVACVPIAERLAARYYELAGLNAALESAVLELMTCARHGTLDYRQARIRAAKVVQQNRAFYRRVVNEERVT